MFEWNDSFSVGIEKIDTQHKKLFEIGKDISDLLEKYDGQDTFTKIMNLLKELDDYTAYHFESEENIMEKYDYAELESHKKEHQMFIDYLRSINVYEMDNTQEESLNKLLKFVAQWIFKHINNTDFKYSSYLINKMSC